METEFVTAENCFYTKIINALIGEHFDQGEHGTIEALLQPDVSDAEQTQILKTFIDGQFDVTLPVDISLRLRTADNAPTEEEREEAHYLVLPPDWEERDRQGTSRW